MELAAMYHRPHSLVRLVSPASSATTVDGAQHARRCELETGICATFQAGLWDLLRDHWPRDEKLVVADVGANKGFFSSRALAVFSCASLA